ncbi:rhophilin-2 isoform X1 [Nematostella vectensis]|uniref:rhophilin-2 isoform X1 n=1 Tax=Nematostella vectensis TaxID=45351 RepID=UPI00207728B1|nr:rhophilin-2 isoform X1 [Nematostella vectensis]
MASKGQFENTSNTEQETVSTTNPVTKKRRSHGTVARVLRENENAAVYRESGRWQLQHKRQALNRKIHKQTKLRDGAENLIKALKSTNDRKLKHAARMELSFASFQLDQLQEELEGINCSLDVYQFDGTMEKQVPMIPLGLRETQDVDFCSQFKEFLQDHYDEDPEKYTEEFARYRKLRKTMCNPSRDKDGILSLYEYYNQMYFVERKFFPKRGSMAVYFHWYDAMTGLPKVQRSAAFEKASVMFNIGALWSQIGTKQDRGTAEGVEEACMAFQKAAGAFRFIRDNFMNSPSVDMTQDTLEALIPLMLVQAQACMWEKRRLLHDDVDGFQECIQAGQECAEISQGYKRVQLLMNSGICMDSIPTAWRNLVKIMSVHYKALSHYHTAAGLLQCPAGETSGLHEMLSSLYISDMDSGPKRKKQAKAHLHAALRHHEEAMRARQVCRFCRRVLSLHKVLTVARDMSTNKLVGMEEEDDFDAPLAPTPVKAYVRQKAFPISPEFHMAPVEDLFYKLGPVHIFNAENTLGASRTVTIHRENGSFGFSVIGSAPMIIQSIDDQGAAWEAGVQVGDIVIGVNGEDVKWGEHHDVVETIRHMTEHVTLQVITPHSLKDVAAHCDLKVVKSDSGSSCNDKSSVSSQGSSSSLSLQPSSSSNDSEGSPKTQIKEENTLSPLLKDKENLC